LQEFLDYDPNSLDGSEILAPSVLGIINRFLTITEDYGIKPVEIGDNYKRFVRTRVGDSGIKEMIEVIVPYNPKSKYIQLNDFDGSINEGNENIKGVITTIEEIKKRAIITPLVDVEFARRFVRLMQDIVTLGLTGNENDYNLY